MKFIFDITKIENKIFLLIVSIIIFTILYSFIPYDELGIVTDNKEQDMADILYISALNQLYAHSPFLMKPKSFAPKMLLLTQIFVTFCLFVA